MEGTSLSDTRLYTCLTQAKKANPSLLFHKASSDQAMVDSGRYRSRDGGGNGQYRRLMWGGCWKRRRRDGHRLSSFLMELMLPHPAKVVTPAVAAQHVPTRSYEDARLDQGAQPGAGLLRQAATSYPQHATPRLASPLPFQSPSRTRLSRMRNLRGLLAVSGHLIGRHAPSSSAAASPHSALFVRALQILSQPEPVRLQKLSAPDSGVVELRLERPEARNAIGKEMLKGLRSAMEKVEADLTANILLVASSVPKVFCAGADLKERRLMGPSEVREFVNSLRATFSSFEALPIPTIAVVEGAAFGGGLELALSCDLRICGESATFCLPETGLAIIPGAGGTQRLPRIVGRSRAMELIFTGRRFDATEAVTMGVVNYCVPGGEAYQKALELAREINQKGPLALRMAKKAINQGMEVDLSSALTVEEECYEQVLHTQDRLEGLAAFAEKRKPVYTGK